MSNLKCAMFFLSVMLLFQSTASAGNWDKYLAIYNRFYLLDQQPIGNVTCSIDTPDLDKWLQLVRSQFVGMGTNLTVIDTLSNYKLTYNRTKGLIINDPTLVITSLSEAASADKSMLNQSVIQINKTEFASTVKGLDSVLRGLFLVLQTPKPGNIDLYYVTVSKGISTVSYGTSGAQVTATFGSDTTAMKITNQFSTQSIHSTYDKTANGKLLLISSQSMLKDLFLTKSITSTVGYQTLGNVEFPARIVTHAKLIGIDMEQTSQVTININDCKLQ